MLIHELVGRHSLMPPHMVLHTSSNEDFSLVFFSCRLLVVWAELGVRKGTAESWGAKDHGDS